jgi:hypothetical protein
MKSVRLSIPVLIVFAAACTGPHAPSTTQKPPSGSVAIVVRSAPALVPSVSAPAPPLPRSACDRYRAVVAEAKARGFVVDHEIWSAKKRARSRSGAKAKRIRRAKKRKLAQILR